MQLIQVGKPVISTVQRMIEQMAARQFSEIEQLKQAVLAKDAARRARSQNSHGARLPLRSVKHRSGGSSHDVYRADVRPQRYNRKSVLLFAQPNPSQ